MPFNAKGCVSGVWAWRPTRLPWRSVAHASHTCPPNTHPAAPRLAGGALTRFKQQQAADGTDADTTPGCSHALASSQDGDQEGLDGRACTPLQYQQSLQAAGAAFLAATPSVSGTSAADSRVQPAHAQTRLQAAAAAAEAVAEATASMGRAVVGVHYAAEAGGSERRRQVLQSLQEDKSGALPPALQQALGQQQEGGQPGARSQLVGPDEGGRPSSASASASAGTAGGLGARLSGLLPTALRDSIDGMLRQVRPGTGGGRLPCTRRLQSMGAG